MKKILIFMILDFVVGLTSLITAQTNDQEWYKLQSPTNKTLRYLTFVDSLTGWAAGEAGTIIHTTDGGNNWVIQNSTVQTFISDIFFLDKNFGWATTIEDVYPFNSIIIKTTNGGEDWSTTYYPDSTTFVRTIIFFDSLNGLAGGFGNYNIAHSSDGGNTWIESDVDSSMYSNFPVYNFKFYNLQFGYACGGRGDWGGVIWRTTDSGLSWLAKRVSADDVFDVFIFDSINALTLSGNAEGLFPVAEVKTTNAGETWSNDELSIFALSFAIDFRTSDEGWSASGYKVLYTSDKGETWTEKDTPDSSIIYDLQFTDSKTGYACGDNGVILKYGSPAVEVEDKLSTIEGFNLEQNYPNPFNPGTKIKYSVPQTSQVQIKVYDVLGNVIETLVYEEKTLGTYELNWSAPNLPSGVYFYQLQAGSYVETKKMVLMK